jgi:hypothetical protein
LRPRAGLLCLLSLACDKPAAPLPAAASRHASVDAAQRMPERPPARTAAPPALRMHVVALHGRPLADCTLARELDLPPACTLALAQGDALTLSLADHVRVTLQGPALARILPAGQPALLLHTGLLTLDVAPRGKHTLESAFWLATPTQRLEVPDQARVALRAYDNQATAIAVVSGFVSVREPELLFSMPAGSTLCTGGQHDALSPLRVTTLALAEAQLARAGTCAPERAGDDALERPLVTARNKVSEVEAAERALLHGHGELVARDPARAAAQRLELAHVGAELLTLRERERALEAQLEAARLSLPPAGP